MRVLTVVGARPQFVKCAVVSRELRRRHEEILVHTGQHYDHGMSERFFEELEIPVPNENLEVSGGSHGQMTGRMLELLERIVLRETPDWILVYGDTNSTLAGALVGSKLHIPVAHVEAGLRSFNRRMPEEINRVVTDHVSTLLLCPTENAVGLLAGEGITKGVHNVGDVMFDSVLQHIKRAREGRSAATLIASLGSSTRVDSVDRADHAYALATLHRSENTDDAGRLGSILRALSRVGLPVLLPLHPRTRNVLEGNPDIARMVGPNLLVTAPLGYRDLLLVAGDARVVLTDSGGLQKEAFFLGVPCVTLRDETEWPETVDAGANRLAGADEERILLAAGWALDRPPGSLTTHEAGPFGDGRAAEKIVHRLEEALLS